MEEESLLLFRCTRL